MYYAVRKGRTPGIYETWQECQSNIIGYSGAEFKKFTTLEDAQAYMNQQEPAQAVFDERIPFAYIDGSFSQKKQQYGYGGFIRHNGSTDIIQGTGSNPDFILYRNITGEVWGAMQVLRRAIAAGLDEIIIYYDYSGVQQWATGAWKTETPLSAYYNAFFQRQTDKIKVHFVHVDGHTGIIGNELADLLAKDAAGVKMTKKQAKMLEEFKAGKDVLNNGTED